MKYHISTSVLLIGLWSWELAYAFEYPEIPVWDPTEYEQELAEKAAKEKAAKEAAEKKAAEKAAKEAAEKKAKEKPAPTYRLTVNTTPKNATVKIMNIKPKYQAGMRLTAGAYKLKVTKSGYETVRKTVNIRNQDLSLTITLKEKPKLAPVAPKPKPVTKPADKLPPIGSSPSNIPIPSLVSIPAGTFTMGCVATRDEVEGGCYRDEKPPIRLKVNAFKLSKYEITVNQYMACVKAGACKQPEWQEQGSPYNIHTGNNNSYKKMGTALTAGNYPIVGVSWHDATTYANWLSQQTGQRWRLPSEAEWEYAARGGNDAQAYPWGQQAKQGCQSANMADQAVERVNPSWNVAACNDGYIYTAPVGRFNANGFGLHDMHGNVWEWVQDCWHGSHQGRPAGSGVWSGGNCAIRVLRGGSWFYNPWGLRSANRAGLDPAYRNSSDGFRLARSK